MTIKHTEPQKTVIINRMYTGVQDK